MKNALIIAVRELKERWNNRSFRMMLFLGPILILGMVYMLLKAGDQGVSNMKVLIADPTNLFENKIASKQTESVTYYFYEDYIDFETFKNSPEFKEFDALIEINEKVLINKKVFLFYRETPSVALKMKLKFEVERRTEEVLIERFTQLSVEDYRTIKQPLNIDFRNIDDPYNQAENTMAWIGYFLGYLMIFFIAVFGTNITKSINREKINRISEVILASVRSSHLMLGKVFGNLFASFLQLTVWFIIVALGFWLLKSFILPEIFTPEYLKGVQVGDSQLKDLGMQTAIQENKNVEFLFHRMHYGILIPFFILFFIGTYWIYASLFTAMGAMSGDESDGQQFIIPIWLLLGLAVFAGYNAVSYPDSGLTSFFSWFPWTSGMVAMVQITSLLGSTGPSSLTLSHYGFYLFSFLIQLGLGSLFLVLAGRIFKHGILSFNHRFSFRLISQWLKK